MARILIIDDEEQVLHLLQETLTRAGHEITSAQDGVEGLKAFKKQPTDLVITDILMPEKDGLDTIREMVALDPKVRIIAISGGGRTGVLDFLPVAQVFGAMYTLTKPFERQDLLNIVNTALSRKSGL